MGFFCMGVPVARGDIAVADGVWTGGAGGDAALGGGMADIVGGWGIATFDRCWLAIVGICGGATPPGAGCC